MSVNRLMRDSIDTKEKENVEEEDWLEDDDVEMEDFEEDESAEDSFTFELEFNEDDRNFRMFSPLAEEEDNVENVNLITNNERRQHQVLLKNEIKS
ncbi:hypothetical protein BDF21DRAFT_463542 [Thamnidium elegans]|nr:hypothetical protein BDF21DRAFT_463542 [Thamnidium elegans]